VVDNAYASDAVGAFGVSYDGTVTMVNDGSITASANYSATGVSLHAQSTAYGQGVIALNFASIVATAGSALYATATGIYVDAPNSSIYNDGYVAAGAAADMALAVGVRQVGAWASFGNHDTIVASAGGDEALAIGVSIDTQAYVRAVNSGHIIAEAAGAYSEAIGVDISSAGLVKFGNYYSISATAEGVATGVRLASGFRTQLVNYGTIEASGAEHNYAIDASASASSTVIANHGTLSGAILTGEGDDYLLNRSSGEWYAVEDSNLGGGDDLVLNYSLLAMHDAVIDLGDAVDGNRFSNLGTVAVDGDNVIDMGAASGAGGSGTLIPAAVPALNPYAFYNDGILDFRDGAADDTLVIVGDFAGDGDIAVDVSGATGASDLLYIDGSVVDGSVGTINVTLLDLPATNGAPITMVSVSGDSSADNFVLGAVDWNEDDSFLALDFHLLASIDESNAEPDTFALGIEVTGLSDAGTVAAAIPSTVAALMNAQVGTWRQRMGVIDDFAKGGISLWARVFYDRGDISPERSLGGNFDHEQMNSGAEGGIDFAVTDEFSLGLLVASARGKSTLEDPGRGTAKVEADTWGVYGTWISPNGFYLDASYRWMDFDVSTESGAGVLEGDGDAEAFNLEVGYAWTLSGGLKIEPQLQYTKTNVDNLSVLVSSTGMRFQSEDGDSSRGRIGVALRNSFGNADSGWLWTPYATLSAVREFDGEGHFAINDAFLGETSVEGTSALLELGATARHGNWAFYGGLNWMDGGAIDSLWGGQLGARYTFGHAAPAPAPVAPPPAKTCADLDDDGDGINNCDDKCLGSTAGQAVGPDGCPVPEPVREAKPYRN
jgi:outer membrane autotransporter protein